VIAYQLAVVVDDADARITHVVRGHDIAPSTATQVMLQRLLGYATPRYRHHMLLLEQSGDKLAKLHGSIPFDQLRAAHSAEELVGLLTAAAGLGDGSPIRPQDIVARGGFDWARVSKVDKVARFNGRLEIVDAYMNRRRVKWSRPPLSCVSDQTR
jgi:glutamyl-Q tRNA(Asp) synthetase